MQTVLFSVFLVTILSIVSTLGSTQLEKHKTMKLVVCNCQDGKHNEEPIHVFDELEFMVIGLGDELRSVAVSLMHLQPVQKKLEGQREPHYFLRYMEPSNSNSITQPLIKANDVFIYIAEKIPDDAADNKLPLNSPSDPKASANISILDGTLFTSTNNKEKAQVAVTEISQVKSTGLTWESVIFTSDGKYKYSMFYNPIDVPQQETTVDEEKQGDIGFTEAQATFVLFVLDKRVERKLGILDSIKHSLVTSFSTILGRNGGKSKP